ncbi:MAG: hypothetical protein N2645_18345 [Clostridia bacterium]|nr:hypothetical protein [Clostridia bacterium]
MEKGYSESVIKCLSNISIPIIAKRDYGVCDGVYYELIINNIGSTLEFSFSQAVPEQWKDVWDMTKRLMGEFDSILINEEYLDSICHNGRLWLEPTSNIKITRELMNFLKQFAGFSGYNVIKISEMFKSEKPVLLEANYDYFHYRSIQSEFIKYGLKVEFFT